MIREKCLNLLYLKPKLIIVFLLSICILIGLTSCKSTTNTNTNKVYNVDHLEFINDFTVNAKGEVFIAYEGQILSYDVEGKSSTSIKIDDFFATNLCMYGEEIVAIDLSRNKILTLNTEGEVLSKKSFVLQFEEISKMRKIEDTLFVLGTVKDHSNKAQQPKMLMKYDLISGIGEEIAVDDINNFCVYDKNSLLLQVGIINSKFLKYDIKTQSLSEDIQFKNSTIKDNFISDYEYDSKSKTLFYISERSLYLLRVDKNKGEEFIDRVHDSMSRSKIALSSNYVFVLDSRANMLEGYGKTAGKNNKNTLVTIMPGEPTVNKAFELQNDVAVVNIPRSAVADWEDIITKLMTGDSSFDIMYLNSGTSKAYNIIRNNAFFDLSESNTLKGYVDGMFKGIKEHSYYDGKLIGIPISGEIDVMLYNKNILAQYNIKADEIVTWEDFFDFISKVANNNNASHGFYANKYSIEGLILEQYIHSYNDIFNGEVNFNTPEFKYTLELMKRAYSNNYFQSHGSDLPLGGLQSHQALAIFSARHSYSEKDVNFVPIPVIDKDKPIKNSVFVEWLIINPRSKNKELAIKYLELYSKSIDPTTGYILKGDNVKGPGGNPEKYHMLKDILDNSVISFNFDTANVFGSVIDEFYADKISVDEAAQRIDEKVKMMIYE